MIPWGNAFCFAISLSFALLCITPSEMSKESITVGCILSGIWFFAGLVLNP